jgi:uncharacterized protein involved in exopolysaccharide biosynthesis
VSEMQEDEIELIDIFRVIWKRRNLIILGTFLLTLGAVGITLILPRVYEITAIIEPGIRPIADENGQIINENPVVSPEALKESILGGAYDRAIQEKLNISEEKYPDLKVLTSKSTILVKVIIESSAPDKAVAILNELLVQVSNDIQGKLESEKRKIENEMKLAQISDKAVGEKTTMVAKQVANTSAKIQELATDRQKALTRSSTEAMSLLLYSNEIQNQQIYLNELKGKLKDLETAALSSVVKMDNLRLKVGLIKSTKVIKPPTVPQKPCKPKRVLIVAMASVLGLMGSLLLAFLLEYFERSGGLSPSGKS